MRQISKLGERFGMATLGGAILQFLFLYLHFTTMYPVLTLYTMGAGYQARNGPAAKRLGPPTGQHGKGTYVFINYPSHCCSYIPSSSPHNRLSKQLNLLTDPSQDQDPHQRLNPPTSPAT